ncbi:hypothetical protein F4780DRAFT_246623 [Xylariomycetidae sp. FL0641]|nr:hypothetical protein F4780DRAFT_246623 [Xylariomycetidae sp. FL0641]
MARTGLTGRPFGPWPPSLVGAPRGPLRCYSIRWSLLEFTSFRRPRADCRRAQGWRTGLRSPEAVQDASLGLEGRPTSNMSGQVSRRGMRATSSASGRVCLHFVDPASTDRLALTGRDQGVCGKICDIEMQRTKGGAVVRGPLPRRLGVSGRYIARSQHGILSPLELSRSPVSRRSWAVSPKLSRTVMDAAEESKWRARRGWSN